MNDECGTPCPGSTRFCQRTVEHDEHRSELTPGRTYVYWFSTGDRTVRYRIGSVDNLPVEYAPASLR